MEFVSGIALYKLGLIPHWLGLSPVDRLSNAHGHAHCIELRRRLHFLPTLPQPLFHPLINHQRSATKKADPRSLYFPTPTADPYRSWPGGSGRGRNIWRGAGSGSLDRLSLIARLEHPDVLLAVSYVCLQISAERRTAAHFRRHWPQFVSCSAHPANQPEPITGDPHYTRIALK